MIYIYIYNVSKYLTRDRICENRFCILMVKILFTMWFTRGEWQRDGVEERRHGVPQVFRNTCGTPVRSTLIQLALKKGQTMPGVECKWMVCGGCINTGSTKYLCLYTYVYVLLTHKITYYTDAWYYTNTILLYMQPYVLWNTGVASACLCPNVHHHEDAICLPNTCWVTQCNSGNWA